MSHPRYLAVLPYLGAVGIVATAVAVRILADPILQNRQPFAVFLVAVLIAGRYCGFLPSLLVVFLSALASRYFFVPPRGSFVLPGSVELASLGFFILIGMLCSLLMRAEQRAKQKLEQEISERKQIEAELRATQDRFHSFVDNGPFLAFMKDEEERYVYVNKLCQKNWSKDSSHWLGRTDYDLFSKEIAECYRQNDRLALQNESFIHFAETAMTPDGKNQHWSTTKFAIRGENGRRFLGGISVEVTETRKAEQQAKESEARLLLALNAGKMGHFEWNMTTNRVRSSDTFSVFHGRSSDQTEMSLEDTISHVHPEDRHIVHDAIERSIKDEAPEAITYRVIWPDGSVHWIETMARVFHDESVGPNRVIGVSKDISERKHAEDALSASEERFRLLAMHAPVGIVQSDAEGRTFFANPKWCEIAGATPEESMGYGWQDFLHPEDRERLIEAWHTDMAAGKTDTTYEFRFAHKDGSFRWASSIAAQVFNPNGKSVGQIGIIEDITERRRSEIALKKAEERFRVLAIQAPVGIFQADAEGRNTFVNQRWCGITGLTAEETLNEGWQRAVHPDDLSRVKKEWSACVQEGREWNDEFRLVNKDGSIRWGLATAAVIHDGHGGSISHIGTILDITERKASQEALRESEERFQAFMNHLPATAWAKNEEGRFVYVNKTYEDRLEVSMADLQGKTDLDIWPQEIAMPFWQSDQKVLATGDSQTYFERHGMGAAPNTDWMKIKFLYRDRLGRKHVGGIGIDITKLKQAEARLKLRESQLTGILDNTTAVVYLKDSEGRYQLTNRRHQDLFQQGDNSIIGKKDSDIFPEAVARTFVESDATVWKEQRPLDFEEVAPHPDGLHTYRSVKFPVRDETGKMIALGGISTDISDLKEAHEALRTKQELLRNLIEVQEKEKQFLCHEFHDGLIQYAVGSLMLLEAYQSKHPASETSAMNDKLIEYLRKGVEDGRRVIRGVRPAVLDDSGLEAAIEDLIEQYSTSGIMVTSNCDPEIGRLPEMIQTTVYRVVQEALSNAKKYSGTDTVSIELKKANGDLHLEIRDFGCGFDLESARKKGFGLLGMTERVRLLGGECQIQSEQDAGTRISVSLPLLESNNDS